MTSTKCSYAFNDRMSSIKISTHRNVLWTCTYADGLLQWLHKSSASSYHSTGSSTNRDT